MTEEHGGTGEVVTPGEPTARVEAPEPPERVDRVWVWMAVLIGADFLLGIGAIATVPYSRASGWLPVKGRPLYVPHAVIGVLLAAGALYCIARYGSAAHRIARLAARWGLVGVVLGFVGGLLAVDHSLRIIGMGLMLVGGLVAGIGYCMPSLEAHDRKERAALAARLEEESGRHL